MLHTNKNGKLFWKEIWSSIEPLHKVSNQSSGKKEVLTWWESGCTGAKEIVLDWRKWASASMSPHELKFIVKKMFNAAYV